MGRLRCGKDYIAALIRESSTALANSAISASGKIHWIKNMHSHLFRYLLRAGTLVTNSILDCRLGILYCLFASTMMMSTFKLLIFCACLLHGINALITSSLTSTCTTAPITLSIDVSSPSSTTAPYFASWNIDSSRDRLFFNISWSNPKLVYLLNQIGNAQIRWGGTGNDALYYGFGDAAPCAPTVPKVYECLNSSWYDDIAALSVSSNSPLVFGLNIHPPGTISPPKGTWNSSNARSLLQYAKSKSSNIAFLELGNEQNTIMSAADEAASFITLAALLDDIYGTGSDRPLLVGPDTHSFHDAGSSTKVVIKFLQDFARATKGVVSGITHHEYIEVTADNVLNSTFLDLSSSIAIAMTEAIRAVSPDLAVWAGEISLHNGGTYGPNGEVPDCSGNHVCGRFGSALWYADSMSAKAAAGYKAYNRQDAIGANYGLINSTSYLPTPDYYLLRVWKATVGSKVLTVQPSPTSLRAYAFCSAQVKNSVTLVLLNIDVSASTCVTLPSFASGNVTIYALTAGAEGVVDPNAYLNGQLLALDDAGHVPGVVGVSINAATGINLPPQSVTFVTIPSANGAVPACA